MKVLEEKPEWGLEIRCRGKDDFDGGCNSLLLAELNDLVLTHTPSPAVRDFEYSTVCPVCGKELAIEKENIPTSIRFYLESKKIKEQASEEHTAFHR